MLISHAPANQVLDLCDSGDNAGSRSLYFRIMAAMPKVVVCGHIHEAAGYERRAGVDFYNVSVLNAQYRRAGSVIRVIEL